MQIDKSDIECFRIFFGHHKSELFTALSSVCTRMIEMGWLMGRWTHTLWYLVSVFGLRVWGFGFRCIGLVVSGFEFRDSCFEFQISGFGFRVSGFGFRVCGFDLPVET